MRCLLYKKPNIKTPITYTFGAFPIHSLPLVADDVLKDYPMIFPTIDGVGYAGYHIDEVGITKLNEQEQIIVLRLLT